MAISTAVSLDKKSRTVGFALKKGDFSETSPNLPMRIAILGEGNMANQSGMVDGTPVQVTSVKQVGELFGFGSPIHQMYRILKPAVGGGVGSIPVIVYPQLEVGTAAARTVTITGSNPTSNGTHSFMINGRMSVDGQNYTVNLLTTDTPTTIATKYVDAVNNVIGSPVIATSSAGVVTLTAKWKGLTSEQLVVEANNFGSGLGITYAVASSAVGSGTPSITAATDSWGSAWNTLVINSYDALVFDDLETLNGTPNDEIANGQYLSTTFKPFVAFWGSTLSTVSGISAITDVTNRRTQVTNVLSPAPNSGGFTYEASANMCTLWALVGQNTPELDVSNKAYPDMPVPEDLKIGEFAVYENRDLLVKAGASTVDMVNGVYTIMDCVTAYRPVGELVPQWSYVRALMQDWNVRYGLFLIEQVHVVDHLIAGNDDVVTASKVIKPKQMIQLLHSYAADLVNRGILTDVEFMTSSIRVGIGESNPDRLETSFEYKRSGLARVSSTTATAGFNFGS